MTRRLALAALAAAALWLGAAPLASAEDAPGLTRIAPEYVCMMNNKRFAEPQIPVEVEGRTYFGCCAMCKERLSQDPGARTAVDPVTGKRVDKASAVIGAAADGRVFYFENDANLAKFELPAKP